MFLNTGLRPPVASPGALFPTSYGSLFAVWTTFFHLFSPRRTTSDFGLIATLLRGGCRPPMTRSTLGKIKMKSAWFCTGVQSNKIASWNALIALNTRPCNRNGFGLADIMIIAVTQQPPPCTPCSQANDISRFRSCRKSAPRAWRLRPTPHSAAGGICGVMTWHPKE